jgi:hypothetical protein
MTDYQFNVGDAWFKNDHPVCVIVEIYSPNRFLICTQFVVDSAGNKWPFDYNDPTIFDRDQLLSFISGPTEYRPKLFEEEVHFHFTPTHESKLISRLHRLEKHPDYEYTKVRVSIDTMSTSTNASLRSSLSASRLIFDTAALPTTNPPWEINVDAGDNGVNGSSESATYYFRKFKF